LDEGPGDDPAVFCLRCAVIFELLRFLKSLGSEGIWEEPPSLQSPLWDARVLLQRFLELSFEIEQHSRGQPFELAMRTFPTAKFHEWCELSKKLQERIELPEWWLRRKQ
jgi:hypothetical protein